MNSLPFYATNPLAGQKILLMTGAGGGMSYSSVWVNGELVGGWPYDYTSWRLDLTPYLKTVRINWPFGWIILRTPFRCDDVKYESKEHTFATVTITPKE